MMQRPATGQSAANAGPHQQRQDPLSQTVEQHRTGLQAMFPVPPSRPPRRKQAAASVATLLLAAGLWWLDPSYRTDHFETKVGDIGQVTLADGSALVLDTATRLEVRWGLRSRRILLEQGRVRFDVTHSPWRPFMVAAGPAQVRVVGTAFDVWRRSETTSVAVYRGRVAVWRSGERPQDGVELGPEQQVELSLASGTAPLQALPITPGDHSAWTHGQLVFSDTPLDQVIATIQRYRALPVALHDRRLARLTLSGVFDSGNTDQLLAILPDILPLSVVRAADGGTELRPR